MVDASSFRQLPVQQRLPGRSGRSAHRGLPANLFHSRTNAETRSRTQSRRKRCLWLRAMARAKLLSKDEARRIAAKIAELPELLRGT
jgi:hypothetical protein